jgi:hypothetical protein
VAISEKLTVHHHSRHTLDAKARSLTGNLNPAHRKHLNVVVEPHDAPDHRFRFPAQPATGTVNLDLLPRPLWLAALSPPEALGLVCFRPHNGVEKGVGFAASSCDLSKLRILGGNRWRLPLVPRRRLGAIMQGNDACHVASHRSISSAFTPPAAPLDR